MTSDKRHIERHNLTDFQQVQDAESGKVIGYLGDISPDGIRVLRKRPVPVGERLRLRLRYMLIGGEPATAEFEAESLWESGGEGLAYPEVGLKFVNVDDEARESIDRIVRDLVSRSG